MFYLTCPKFLGKLTNRKPQAFDLEPPPEPKKPSKKAPRNRQRTNNRGTTLILEKTQLFVLTQRLRRCLLPYVSARGSRATFSNRFFKGPFSLRILLSNKTYYLILSIITFIQYDKASHLH